MSAEREMIRATIAAAIIVSRGAKSVEEIVKAWLDAQHILNPSPTNKAYKEWQVANGLTPTTPEEDAAAAAGRTSRSSGQYAGAGPKDWMTR